MAYLNRGVTHLFQKQFDPAIRDFDQALRVTPRNAHVLVQRATAYYFKKQPERALTDLNEAIRIDANRLQAYKLRGGILGVLGKRDQAIADFRKVLELNPANENAKKNLRDLGAAP